MNREQKSRLVLQAALISYIIGCALSYFFWYKNGQTIHIAMMALVMGGIGVFISVFKTSNVILKRANGYKTFFILLFIIVFISVAGFIDHLAQKRVNDILNDGPTKQAIATVVKVDMRSTRSGHQAWSIINYNATGTTIEQSFADTSGDLRIGRSI